MMKQNYRRNWRVAAEKRRTESMSEIAEDKLVSTNCVCPVLSAEKQKSAREVKLNGTDFKTIELFGGRLLARNCTINMSVDNRYDKKEAHYGWMRKYGVKHRIWYQYWVNRQHIQLTACDYPQTRTHTTSFGVLACRHIWHIAKACIASYPRPWDRNSGCFFLFHIDVFRTLSCTRGSAILLKNTSVRIILVMKKKKMRRQILSYSLMIICSLTRTRSIFPYHDTRPHHNFAAC